MKAADPSPQPCPCGRKARLADCCGRWHVGPMQGQAPDAEALMRSRYSAYVLGLADYLRATWHPRTRPAQLDLDPAVRWLGLEVRRHQVVDADHAVVEFVARSKQGGRAQRLHETSRFVRENARWFYIDGDHHDQERNSPPGDSSPKASRG
jgi:SEC-C motif domain protein